MQARLIQNKSGRKMKLTICSFDLDSLTVFRGSGVQKCREYFNELNLK